MSKQIKWEVLPEMHGKITGKSRVYFAHRTDSDTCYSAACPDRSNFVPTTAQEEAKRKFGETATKVATIMADPDQLEDAMERFGNQKKYKTLRGFLFAEEYAKATV